MVAKPRKNLYLVQTYKPSLLTQELPSPPSPTFQGPPILSPTPSSPTMSSSSSSSKTSTFTPGDANISVREYIYHIPHSQIELFSPELDGRITWPYTPGLPHENPLYMADKEPTEPTSTLVLTSPHSTFVDVRVLKGVWAGEEQLPNDTQDEDASDRLEWAFAGESKSEATKLPNTALRNLHKEDYYMNGHTFNGIYPPIPTPDAENLPPIRQSTWTHWIDSNHPIASPSIPLDTAAMYPITNTITLEFGTSLNALNGPQYHEELWRDIPILPSSSQTSISLNPSLANKKHCIVLRTEGTGPPVNDEHSATPTKNHPEPEDLVRGLIIRLGQYCQGILKRGSAPATVERWEFSDDQWKRTVKIGSDFLPCAAAMKHQDLVLGGKVAGKGYVWTVEELVEWE